MKTRYWMLGIITALISAYAFGRSHQRQAMSVEDPPFALSTSMGCVSRRDFSACKRIVTLNGAQMLEIEFSSMHAPLDLLTSDGGQVTVSQAVRTVALNPGTDIVVRPAEGYHMEAFGNNTSVEWPQVATTQLTGYGKHELAVDLGNQPSARVLEIGDRQVAFISGRGRVVIGLLGGETVQVRSLEPLQRS